ncbi:hypothetical protein GQ53DRAFT_826649 [Thozetella sp. PMI_491]|nr:hypothetical protein GQ53DRAFT_826649 [Thozetella sp. PMI_491]
MKMHVPSFLGTAALMQAAASLQSETSCPEQGATEFALTYGDPLLSYRKTFIGRLDKIGLNQLLTTTQLSTPSETATVKPNVDTLYMSQCYEVSEKDIVVNIGEVEPGRYYSVAFYTAYGDNYLSLGALTSAKSGKYLLTLTTSSIKSGTIEISNSSDYQGTIYSPGTIGFFLVRIAVRDRVADLLAVQKIQRGFSTTLVTRGSASVGPPLSAELFRNTSGTQEAYLLSLTGRFLNTVPQATDAAYSASVTSQYAYSTSGSFLEKLSNGWTVPRSNKIGLYGTDYTARAYVARWGYLAMTDEEALYPSYMSGFSLQSNESYVLTFSGRPPVKDVGFWSLTMYNSAGYLVANDLNRYSLGDKDNLTLPDATPIYSQAGKRDEPFDILVQAARPPANWTTNWLPSPATPGSFDMLCKTNPCDFMRLWMDFGMGRTYILRYEKVS